VNTWNFLAGPSGRDLICQAWRKWVIKEWNLSEEMITSRKAKAALRNYLSEHPEFRTEIENKIGDVNLEAEPVHEGDNMQMDYDDSDVPLQSVIQILKYRLVAMQRTSA